MKKSIFIFSYIFLFVILFTACNKTDYNNEFLNSSSNYNTIVPLMTKVHTSVINNIRNNDLKGIQAIVDPAEKTLNEQISAIESRDISDDAVKKLYNAELEYLKSEKSMVDKYIKLYTNADNMGDSQMKVIMDELSLMDETVTKNLENWDKIKAQFEKDQNINLSEKENQ